MLSRENSGYAMLGLLHKFRSG